MWIYFAIGGTSLIVSLAICLPLCAKLRKAGIVGLDVHKPKTPPIPEMGGLVIVIGFSAGILVAIALCSFFHLLPATVLPILLATVATVLMAALVGLIDDLVMMRQAAKAFLPAVASLPLMAIRIGQTKMMIPFIGLVDFWIFYPLLVVPGAVAVASNAVNMLAGFNGLEAGMGLVIMACLAVIAAHLGQVAALLILCAGIGALLAFILFNWYPARIFIGDVGTLTVGTVIASSIVVGGFETAGVILLIPFGVDFLIKAAHRFPKTFAELGEDGKLHCPPGPPKGLGQLILRISGGLHERVLVLLLLGGEAVLGAGAILLYYLR